MKNLIFTALTIASVTGGLLTAQAQDLKGKKALVINSYHEGYAWSDQEEKAALAVLSSAGVQTKVFRMDTYRQKSPEYLASVSLEAKALIDEWKPDVVVTTDDPVMKGVYVPFYKGKDLPFVACGLNWDALAYGLPDPNIKNFTTMIEVCPVKELVVEMTKLKPGKTIGFLSSDAPTPRKDVEGCSKILGVTMEAVFAKDFASWKQGYLDLQGKVDFLIIGPNGGIADWDEAEAVKFVEQNAKTVSGSCYDFLNGLALVSFNKLGAEQGDWAGNTALQVLKGKVPSAIPFSANKNGAVVFNVRIAKKVGVTPSFEALQNAKVIE